MIEWRDENDGMEDDRKNREKLGNQVIKKLGDDERLFE